MHGGGKRITPKGIPHKERAATMAALRFAYTRDSPALAKPVIVVAMSMPSVTSAENTSSRRVVAETGMFKPVIKPLLMVPMLTAPVRSGNRLTEAPTMGVKILLGAVD